jgi:hypothetical protein
MPERGPRHKATKKRHFLELESNTQRKSRAVYKNLRHAIFSTPRKSHELTRGELHLIREWGYAGIAPPN